MRLEIRLGARDEESPRQMQAMQASEVDIAAIEVEGAQLFQTLWRRAIMHTVQAIHLVIL